MCDMIYNMLLHAMYISDAQVSCMYYLRNLLFWVLKFITSIEGSRVTAI
jgi:hypothetical protein